MKRLLSKGVRVVRAAAGTGLAYVKSIGSRFRVDFVVAGAQKGGTTALDAYLRQHPGICMADRKEVHFFDKGRTDRSRVLRRPLYHTFFDPKEHHRVVGECTPVYMYREAAPRRIWAYNPLMKIVIVLRNPVDRAFSHWNMERDRGTEDWSFRDAITRETERCRDSLPHRHRFFSYVDRGYYSEQLRRIWRFFPREQTLILRNEELRNEPEKVLDRVAALLEIDPFPPVRAKDVHSRPYVSEMEDREREFLLRAYEFEIRTLERMLDWDLTDWLEGS